MSRPPHDSRQWWRQHALSLRWVLNKTRHAFTQVVEDHDALEAELKALLTPERNTEPNPSLLTLSHHDLALLADEWRVKLLNQ